MGKLRADKYRDWLEREGLAKSSIDTRISHAKRVEEHYDDLDGLFDEDRLEGVIGELQYSAEDKQANAPNPSQIPIDGDLNDNLASYRAAVRKYREYRETNAMAVSEDSRFHGLEFYRALADRLLDFRDDRTPLVKGIHELATSEPLLSYLQKDRFADGTGGPLTDICPFTVTGMFNRGIKADNRRKIAAALAEMLGVEVPVPEAFRGIPVLDNRNSWFFGTTRDRGEGDIGALWRCFEAAVRFADSGLPENRAEFAQAYRTAANLGGIAGKLTIGFFWARPWNFVSLDRRAWKYIEGRLDLDVPREPGKPDAYLELLDSLNERFRQDDAPVHSFPELSLAAWNERSRDTDDENLLAHFDGQPAFRDFRRNWTQDQKALFCRLARAVNDAGLDWWHSGEGIRLRFGRKNPGAAKAEGVLGGVRGKQERKISWQQAIGALPPARRQPLTGQLVAQIEAELAAEPRFPDDWRTERLALWPDQLQQDPVRPDSNADDAGEQGPTPKRLALNRIYYGPPGTGKTFSTAGEAVRLCGEPVPEDREDLMRAYRRLAAAGRIEFVTFHQSMSYEDFVEGRQPMTGADDGDDTASAGFRLETVPGIFRRIARRAETSRGPSADDEAMTLSGRQIFKMSIGDANDSERAHLFEEAIAGGYTLIGYEDIDWSDDKYASREAIIEACKAEGKLEGHTDVNAFSGAVQMPFIFRNWVNKGDIVIVSKGNSLFRAIGEFTGDYEFRPRPEGGYAHRRAVRWLWADRQGVPVSEIYSRRFTQKTIYALFTDELNIPALERYLNSQQADGPAEPEAFVLIIDEINRANISKVFGELITLLEPDKRLGQPNELKVRLPYSGDDFGVPSNLHIVGTMNTADRSIALLDTALRRRFTFREMMPDASLLANAAETCGLDLPRLLATINERIEYLYDREHRIGHACFMDCASRADVDAVMRNKVIPLLAEYFFEDREKVAAVLGDAASHDRSIEGKFLNRFVLKAPPGLDDGDALPRFRWTFRSEDEGFDYTGLVDT